MSSKSIDFAVLFTTSLVPLEIQAWIDQHVGSVRFIDALYNIDEASTGLIRDLTRNGIPHILRGVQFVTSEDILSGDAMDIDASDSLTEQLRAKGRDEELIVLETSKLSRR